MSKIVTLLLFLGTFCTYGQIVNIPDAGFKTILVNVNVVDNNGDGIPEDDVDTNNDGEVQVSEAEAVIRLLCDNMNQNVQSLEGIQSFANLEVLDVVGNSINDIDITQNSNLKRLDAWGNAIPSIDVTQNPLLEYLWIGMNPISTIDISQNPLLERFYCYETSISTLDVSNNPLLIRLGIGTTNISSINLSQNPNITGLFTYETSITSIDVSNLSQLDQFYTGRNNIASLDLSQNPNLRQLVAEDMELTFLDVSQNPLLELIWVSGNDLNGLNIANGSNIILSRMWAYDNPNLLCIQVDDIVYANNQNCNPGTSIGWCKDETAAYAEQCELGVAENLSTHFMLYPNPAKDVLHIETSASPIEMVRIISSEGKQIATYLAAKSIDVSQLASGLYFVEISSEGQKQISKFIKN